MIERPGKVRECYDCTAPAAVAQWRQLMARLAKRYHPLAPDLLGYGHTGAWPQGRSDLIADEVAIARAMLDRLRQPVHVVGHSYGGHIAARTALHDPERIASLPLIEPALFYLLVEAGETEACHEIRTIAFFHRVPRAGPDAGRGHPVWLDPMRRRSAPRPDGAFLGAQPGRPRDIGATSGSASPAPDAST